MKKAFKFLVLVFALILYKDAFFPTVAHAYIDPSTTTYLIQAVAGIAVAVGSFVVIYWRRAKKRINEKMGIDLDKNKEVEEDVVVKEKKD